MTKPLQQIMKKDMSRKEFLMTMGFGMASVFGFSSVIHMLTGESFSELNNFAKSAGYGSSPYGR